MPDFFFNKAAGLQLRCFPVNFLRNFHKHLFWRTYGNGCSGSSSVIYSVGLFHRLFSVSILKFGFTVRSSHRRCSFKKAFLKNFAIFPGKNLFCWLSDLQLFQKETSTQVFSCEHCGHLLLYLLERAPMLERAPPSN